MASDGALFENCVFSRVKIRTGSLGGVSQAVFRNCTFDRCSLTARKLIGNARFESCRFLGTAIASQICEYAEFLDRTFTGVISNTMFFGRPVANIWEVPRKANDFVRNDFSGVTLRHVSFMFGIPLDGNRFPAGDEYVLVRDFQGAFARARREVDQWPVGRDRDEALSLLNAFTVKGLSEQEFLFARRGYPNTPPDTEDAVWSLLLGRSV